ncbi:HNH endonuclease [Ochrobactrum sp. SFR4]|uniref:HNH endonuclease n=1 Tax=Ochrobactrum sp. SFR4 TaxID=2717368 RepID=UPI001C8C3BD8|nr:HNH endonuclease [Ochrobactrum sp. SFR4]MBX8827447.1 HNH endonuclease [Ochrobactrum sp. SFR4]
MDKLNRGNWKYWHVYDAVVALNGRATIKDLTRWLGENYPGENHTDVRENARLLCVNDHNRRHHDKGRKSFRSDQANKKDVLFREQSSSETTYLLYNQSKHGIWDIRPDSEGVWKAVQISSVSFALEEAHRQIALENKPAIENEYDARVWELRAIALREGQHDFRNALLKAYEGKCAITGCGVVEILEAAHIHPYRGKHTHRTDNGLLLRADMHTLFDKGLVYIDAQGLIQIDERLLGSESGLVTV